MTSGAVVFLVQELPTVTVSSASMISRRTTTRSSSIKLNLIFIQLHRRSESFGATFGVLLFVFRERGLGDASRGGELFGIRLILLMRFVCC